MVFGTHYSKRVSKKHKYEFDEYMVVVAGKYTAIIFDDRKKIIVMIKIFWK